MHWFPPTDVFLTSLVLNAYYIKKFTYGIAPGNNEIGSPSRSFNERDASTLKSSTETEYNKIKNEPEDRNV